MPTYDYECNGPTAHRFEKFQKFSDPPLAECPECGASVRRVIYPAGVIFKGPGFYKTDYAAKAGARSDDGDAKSDGKPAEAKSDTAEKAGAKADTTEKTTAATD